mgnify:CR=1 FL=1
MVSYVFDFYLFSLLFWNNSEVKLLKKNNLQIIRKKLGEVCKLLYLYIIKKNLFSKNFTKVYKHNELKNQIYDK